MPENQLKQAFVQNDTRENKYLHALEFDKVLELVSNCANTPLGKAECLNLKPFTNIDTIKQELNFVSEARKIYDETASLGSIPVNFICDAKKILEVKRLGAQDIWDLTKTIQTSRITKTFLQKNENANLLKKRICGKINV